MKKYDLLVVGNGFDLGCDYKTSFDDFLEYEGNKGIQNPLISFFLSASYKGFIVNKEWNGFEKILCQYLQFLDYCFNNKSNIDSSFSETEYDIYGNPFHRWFEWKICDVSALPNNIFLILCLANPLDRKIVISSEKDFKMSFAGLDSYGDIKEVFFKVFINAAPVNATKEYVLAKLLDELDQRLLNMEKELKQYIELATKGHSIGPAALRDDQVKTIVSFNYSKTAQTIYKISDSDIAYVHGSISSNIVIGVEPSMIYGQSFKEDSDFIKFFKRFRRIYKECNYKYNENVLCKMSEDSVVAIYGHSLDMSDISLLKPLFENRYKEYDIYCYKETNSYKLKLAKLIGLDLYSELTQAGKINMIKID